MPRFDRDEVGVFALLRVWFRDVVVIFGVGGVACRVDRDEVGVFALWRVWFRDVVVIFGVGGAG